MRSIVQPTGGGDLGEAQVLLDGEPGDDAPVLGHQRHPVPRRLEGAHAVKRLVVEPDLAVLELGRVDAGDGAQRRGLAGAVAAEEREDLALVHLEGDPLHDVALAVVGVEVVGGEIGRGRAEVARLPHPLLPPFFVEHDCLAHRWAPPR